MSGCSDLSDYDWLTSDEAAVLLHELAASPRPLHTAVAGLRRHLSPLRTHLVAEQVELRRRAAAKFSAAGRMFFTRTGLEQATDESVARYKATRLAQRVGSVHSRSTLHFADLCCGIGGDLISLAQKGSVVAADNNSIAAHFAAANMRAVVPTEEVQFHTTDASDIDLHQLDAWHIDPDRRPGGRRTTSLEFCQPDLTVIERFLRRVPHAAIKLAPATKTPSEWANQCELEWISRGGECRQLVAWHGNLAEHRGQHRATILTATCGPASAAKPEQREAIRSVAGDSNVPIPITRKLCRYIFDVDPAVLAARLKGALAAEHNLQALDTGGAYLTGDSPVYDPALGCFHVDDIVPMRTPRLAKHLRDRHIGQLEIKKSGVDIVPENLRRELKLRGDSSATLLIAKLAGRPTAILAHRCDSIR